MKLLVSSLLVILFYYNICLVGSIGLNEEFTWTRITFVERKSRYYRPKNVEISSKGGYVYSGGDALVFPEDDPVSSTTNRPDLNGDNANLEYIYENNIPMGANRWKNKLFITIPRRRLGVPSTLNYVPIDKPERHNVPLIPYPDLKTNAMRATADQEHIISTYRVAIDACDRLWTVDTGIVETLGNQTQLGEQRIIIIDLNTDKIIKTYRFKDSDLTHATVLAMTVVDVTSNNCDDAYAYFPDLAGFGLVVYSLKKDESWRVKHNYFYLEPQAGEFRIGGIPFQWNDGVFSAALTDARADGSRDMIFHSMAGTHLYVVSTKILKDKDLATRSYHEDDFKVLGDRGPGSQTSASDLHKSSGILFLSMVNQNAVGCWDTNKPFEPKNFGIVQRNDSTMVYPADLKIYQDDIIVLTNSMPVFLYSSLNYDEINFRVWMNNVYEAVKGTNCDNSI
ncbi:protein yellow-related [Holotrichia oblita]|uniref:Protein yellow-related n=1 Tax=Holotrichia oblita TaxID=644536 RepID=A0ACB9T0J2_HOLOL|nr:protein yellow-related [Holotrichia oblita]